MCGHKLPDSVRCVWLQSHVASKTGVTRPADGAAGTGPGRVGGKNDTSGATVGDPERLDCARSGTWRRLPIPKGPRKLAV